MTAECKDLMSDAIKRCGTQIAVNLVTVVLIGIFGLWLKSAVASQLDDYVTQTEFSAHRAAINARFERLEKIIDEGRAERLAFQREVIERLARIETELKHVATKP